MLIESNLVFGLAVSIKLCDGDPMGSSVPGSEKGSVARDKTEGKASPRGIEPFHGAKGFGLSLRATVAIRKLIAREKKPNLNNQSQKMNVLVWDLRKE